MAVYSDYVAIFGSMSVKQVQEHVRGLAHGNEACRMAIEHGIKKTGITKGVDNDMAMYAWTILHLANRFLEKNGSHHCISILT